jgi:hypothetical protein
MNPHVASIKAASGVKSAVISSREPRGRTPIALLFRFAASSATGAGRMCVSRNARFEEVRFVERRAAGNEKL